MLEAPRSHSPVVRIANEAGLRFGLNKDEFDRWWTSLHPEDAESFLYHGGDELLAQFVCCFDYLTSQGKRGAIVAAYAVAVDGDPHDRSTQERANAAWEHSAVRDLLDRLNYRESRMARTRIERKYVSKLEGLLDKSEEMEPDAAAKIVDLAGKFVKQSQELDERLRRSRDRRSRLSPGPAGALREKDREDIEQYAEVLGKAMRPILNRGDDAPAD